MTFNEKLTFGKFFQNDGTIDFYLRIRSILKKQYKVLDYGAGRAGWYDDDYCETRKNLRFIKEDVEVLIAADVDKGVLNNQASHKQIIITDDFVNQFEKNYFDIIICDFVLEHVEDVNSFKKNIDFLLKENGLLCARTPHKLALVSILAQIIPNSLHDLVLKFAQPEKKEIDTFDTCFNLNTIKTVSKLFSNYENYSFIYKANIGYHFNSKIIFSIFKILNFILPYGIGDNCFFFLKKIK